MKTNLIKIITSVAVLTILPLAGYTQDSPSTSGEIELDLTERKHKNPYKENQDNAIQYFKNLETKLTGLQSDDTSTLELLGQNSMLHVAGVYLYCSIHNGICPEVLDAVLEIDIINSRLNKEAKCPAMKTFWTLYIQNDMKKKHGFQVKTGFMRTTQDFEKDVLPQYLRCSKTVAKQIALQNGEDDATFFKQRYGEGSRVVNSISKTNLYLDNISKTVGNVFSETSGK